MKKYAVIGAHGSGKSSFAYMLASYFKKLGNHVDVIQERVRYSPFPFNEGMSEDTALWVYHSHIARELEAKARGASIIICDRSALDSFIYAEYFNLDNKKLNFCKHHAIKWLESYNQIFIVSPDITITDDGIRGLDKDYQENVDRLFKEHLELIAQYLKIEVCYLKSSEIFHNQFEIEKVIKSE